MKYVKKFVILGRYILNGPLVQEINPGTFCDEHLSKLLKKSIKERKLEVVEMESGAGHDGMIISSVAPLAMLFVKCFKGISHNPLGESGN